MTEKPFIPKQLHWYAFRFFFVEIPPVLIRTEASSKQEAMAKLPQNLVRGACSHDVRSFDDKAGAEWQIEQWKKEADR